MRFEVRKQDWRWLDRWSSEGRGSEKETRHFTMTAAERAELWGSREVEMTSREQGER